MPNEDFILMCGAKLAAGYSKTLGYIIGNTFSQREKKIEKRLKKVSLKTSKVIPTLASSKIF